ARTHDVAIAIERDFLLVPGRQRERLGPRPNPAHLPADDVDDLRQLVEPRTAQDLAEAGNALVARSRHEGVTAGRIGRPVHGTKLDHAKKAAAISHAGLPNERRTAAVPADSESDDAHQRKRNR